MSRVVLCRVIIFMWLILGSFWIYHIETSIPYRVFHEANVVKTIQKIVKPEAINEDNIRESRTY